MLCAEMKTSKPRRDTFLPLMKSTFTMRRHYILHSAVSVQHILREYPALKEPVAVRYSTSHYFVIVILKILTTD